MSDETDNDPDEEYERILPLGIHTNKSDLTTIRQMHRMMSTIGTDLTRLSPEWHAVIADHAANDYAARAQADDPFGQPYVLDAEEECRDRASKLRELERLRVRIAELEASNANLAAQCTKWQNRVWSRDTNPPKENPMSADNSEPTSEPTRYNYRTCAYCPWCGHPSISRERRPNGDDRCSGGHTYPSATALIVKPSERKNLEAKSAQEAMELLREALTLLELEPEDHKDAVEAFGKTWGKGLVPSPFIVATEAAEIEDKVRYGQG